MSETNMFTPLLGDRVSPEVLLRINMQCPLTARVDTTQKEDMAYLQDKPVRRIRHNQGRNYKLADHRA